MIQNIKNIYVKKTILPVAIALLRKIQANVFYLHFNKNFITLDLKMQTSKSERISKGRMFHLSTIL